MNIPASDRKTYAEVGVADFGNLARTLFFVRGGSRLFLQIEIDGAIHEVFDASGGAAVACFGNGDGSGDGRSQPHDQGKASRGPEF
ncbi:hypothetical protein BX600DRAFT_469975 [Xylariales sp. PMI_506]|nr:hypothetical protein BX600DRAFT_469975 [Xylariales sp. PMI_506]